MSPPDDIARLSPCQKSKRGAAIWMPDDTGGHDDFALVSTGHNALASGVCTGSVNCRSTCGKRCEHAEAAAIRRSRGVGCQLPLELLHVKVVDGALVASGQPSCWQCSKTILADGRIAGVCLLHEDGWRRYTAAEFHRLTLEGCDLIDRWQA